MIRHWRGIALLSWVCSTALISGCAGLAARINADRLLNDAPTRITWMYSEVTDHQGENARVRVFSIEGRHEGLTKTDYGTLEMPIYLLPGSCRVRFACPGARVHSDDNRATIRVPRHKASYLYCDEQERLQIAPSEPTPRK